MNSDTISIWISTRFQRHYSCSFDERDVPARPFPLTWNVDVLPHGRSQLLVLASEEYSLYSVLIALGRGREISSFLNPFRVRLIKISKGFRDWPDNMPVRFSNRTNRRVIGSQNDLLYLMRQYLNDANKPASPIQSQLIEERLNSTPMSYLKMDCPRKAFQNQMATLKSLT